MTPVVHSAVGLLGWQLSDSEKNIKTLFLFVLVSNLPDIDFLLFVFFKSGDVQIHQWLTHNIFFITFFTLPLFFFFKARRERIALLLVAFSHLLLDLVIIDPVPPIGIRIFYPAWNRLFNFGFFPNFLRGGVSDIFSWHNLMTVSLEVLCFVLPILAFCGGQFFSQLRKERFWNIK